MYKMQEAHKYTNHTELGLSNLSTHICAWGRNVLEEFYQNSVIILGTCKYMPEFNFQLTDSELQMKEQKTIIVNPDW